jgi:chromosome segregation ATPase
VFERDYEFSEKTTLISNLRKKCDEYQQLVRNLSEERDELAIQKAVVADGVGGNTNAVITNKLQKQFEDKVEELNDSNNANAQLQSELKRSEKENAEFRHKIELLEQNQRRVAAPVEVSVTKLSSELKAAQEELARIRKKDGPDREESQRALASMRESESRALASQMEMEKKLAKVQNAHQRSMRDILKYKRSIEILEEKLTQTFVVPGGGIPVIDIVRQYTSLEANYRCLVEEADEKENEQITHITNAFQERKAEFDASLKEKQAENENLRRRLDELQREKNSISLELDKHRLQMQAPPPEMEFFSRWSSSNLRLRFSFSACFSFKDASNSALRS